MIDTRPDAQKTRALSEHLCKAIEHLGKARALMAQESDTEKAPIERIVPEERLRPEEIRSLRRFPARGIGDGASA